MDITFESMDDFSPAAVARKVDALNKLLEARMQLSNLITYMDGKAGAEELIAKALNDPALLKSLVRAEARRRNAEAPPPSISQFRGVEPWPKPNKPAYPARVAAEADQFAALLQKQFKPKTDGARAEVERAVQTLAEQALRETTVVSDDVVGTIKAIIAEIDKKLTDQINLILHNERFQQVESAWRGLHYLVNNTETDEMLKIRVMNVSKKDLGKTLKKYKGASWDQSPIFKKLYEQEYGQLGGEPYGASSATTTSTTRPADVELLGQMAQVAAAAHAPFIAGRRPDAHGHGFLAGARQPARSGARSSPHPTMPRGARCASRTTPSTLGLAMPRFLARLPYGAKTDPVEEFEFEEETGGGDSQPLLLGELPRTPWR